MKTKKVPSLLPAKRGQAGDGTQLLEQGCPRCGLNTFTRGVQKAAKKLLAGSWLGVNLLTVARPRGFCTRFPILPAESAENPEAFIEKILTALAEDDGAEVITH